MSKLSLFHDIFPLPFSGILVFFDKEARACAITYGAQDNIDLLTVPYCHCHTCANKELGVIMTWGG